MNHLQSGGFQKRGQQQPRKDQDRIVGAGGIGDKRRRRNEPSAAAIKRQLPWDKTSKRVLRAVRKWVYDKGKKQGGGAFFDQKVPQRMGGREPRPRPKVFPLVLLSRRKEQKTSKPKLLALPPTHERTEKKMGTQRKPPDHSSKGGKEKRHEPPRKVNRNVFGAKKGAQTSNGRTRVS